MLPFQQSGFVDTGVCDGSVNMIVILVHARSEMQGDEGEMSYASPLRSGWRGWQESDDKGEMQGDEGEMSYISPLWSGWCGWQACSDEGDMQGDEGEMSYVSPLWSPRGCNADMIWQEFRNCNKKHIAVMQWYEF